MVTKSKNKEKKPTPVVEVPVRGETNEQHELEAYPKQMEFIEDKTLEAAFIAGVGAGKTYAGAIKALMYNIKHKGAWGIVTAPKIRILEDATIPTYDKVFPQSMIDHRTTRPHAEWYLVNGGRISFWSTDKPDNIAGMEMAWAHMDEASLSPYQAYLNIKKRLRQVSKKREPYPYQLWMTTSPRQLNWLYNEIMKENSPIKMYNATTLDNIYLPDPQAYIANMGLTGKQYEHEIEGKFVMLSGDCLFDNLILQERLSDLMPPVRIMEDGFAQIWKEQIVGATYIAAADCADEGGGGHNDLVIMDLATGEEVAGLNADIPADEFAVRAKRILDLYDDPLFAPERNGTVGGIVVTKFQDMAYPKMYKNNKGKAGWFTSNAGLENNVGRYQMLMEYEEAVRKRATIIHSAEVISEMSTFIRSKDDRFEPREGCRGDRVMSRAICWQLRKAHVYKGIGFSAVKRKFTTYM